MTTVIEHDWAVITGDLVRSSSLSAVERAGVMGEIKRASVVLREAYPEVLPRPIDIFRGDSWQTLVARPESALRIALVIRAWIRTYSPEGHGVDTRMAVAIGRIEPVSPERVSEGDGEAFRASGRALDTLREPLRLALIPPPETPKGAARVLQAWVPALDALIQDWTQCQARAVLLRLQGDTQEKIASKWPERVTRQAIARHLAKAHWPALEAALVGWESNFWKLHD